jgi:hypothetical protein
MVKVFGLKYDFEEKFENRLKEEKNNIVYLFYYRMVKFKELHNRSRKYCFFCNRYIMEKYDYFHKIQFDNHIYDHFMMNESLNNIPISLCFMGVDIESILFDINAQKSSLIRENFFNYSSKNLYLLHEISFYSLNIRQNRNYIFSKYRISKFFKSLVKKQINTKNILHGWNDKRGPKKNWMAQRGEVLIGFPETFRAKKEGLKKTLRMLFHKSSLSLTTFNKRIYELELIKRLICIKLSNFSLNFHVRSILQYFERINLFRYHDYLANVFSYTIWKSLNFETTSNFRFKFFNNLFYLTDIAINFFYQFTRKFLV